MAQDYSRQDREEVFSQRHMSEEMNIKDKVREARDSEEHPNSFPIIIALDVTGSMGRIPYELITEGFPKLMKKIMDEGVQDLQVCFVGIGDHYTDRAPIQVGQFESQMNCLISGSSLCLKEEVVEIMVNHIHLHGILVPFILPLIP